MDLQSRLQQAQMKFDEYQQTREKLLRDAEDCLAEMNRLQGEFRVISDLMAAENLPATDEVELLEDDKEPPKKEKAKK